MLFSIDAKSNVPIWEQIVSQVIFAIASGSLRVGDLIPSVRVLAERVLAHPNTVAKAFQELERRGLLVSRRGKGMEVTPEGPALCRALRQEIVRERIRGALREAVSSALSAAEIRKLVEEELVQANGLVARGSSKDSGVTDRE